MFGGTEPKIVTGVFTWIGIVMVALVVYWMTRRRNQRLEPRTLQERNILPGAL
jgi:LPXTG-motif cell wall-anchored protein